MLDNTRWTRNEVVNVMDSISIPDTRTARAQTDDASKTWEVEHV